MRALVAHPGGRLALEQRPLPEPGAGEVRLRVEACGICGSDLHLASHGLYAPGVTPGHEFAGRVEALGPGVERVAPGDRVAVEPFRSCGDCAACRAGRDPLCATAKLLGVHVAGGLAEAVVVPATRLYPVPEELDARVAALAEPAAVAVHGLARCGEPAPERLLVLGAGSIGLLTLLAARAAGVRDVTVSARHAHQAELARHCGAHTVMTETEAGPEALARLGRRDPFDAVIETVGGSADTLAHASLAVRPGGCVSVLGFFLGRVGFDPLPFMLKEVTLAWSYCYQRGGEPDFARALRLLGDERERAACLTTHAVPLDEAPRAYELAADKRRGAIKVSVLP